MEVGLRPRRLLAIYFRSRKTFMQRYNDRVLNYVLGSCTAAALVSHFVLRAPLLALVLWLAFLCLLVCSKATALFETTAWSVVTRAWEFAFDWWMVPLLAVAWRVRAVVRAKKKT